MEDYQKSIKACVDRKTSSHKLKTINTEFEDAKEDDFSTQDSLCLDYSHNQVRHMPTSTYNRLLNASYSWIRTKEHIQMLGAEAIQEYVMIDTPQPDLGDD